MSKRYCIYRYPEGVVLNPREYVLDDEGQVMYFGNETEAKAYLMMQGIPPKDIGHGIYIEEEK